MRCRPSGLSRGSNGSTIASTSFRIASANRPGRSTRSDSRSLLPSSGMASCVRRYSITTSEWVNGFEMLAQMLSGSVETPAF